MAQLKPQSVFDCFAQINQVPRPSKREEKITAFLRKFGEDLGLETLVDEAGNVLIRKPGTPGFQNRDFAEPPRHGLRKEQRRRI